MTKEQTMASVDWLPDHRSGVGATGSFFSHVETRRVRPRCTAEAVWVAAVACMLPRTGIYSLEDYELDMQSLKQFGTTNFSFDETTEAQLLGPEVVLGSNRIFESTSPFMTACTRFAPKQVTQQVPSISETLLRLRAHFSLNTSEVARVFGVERPTIYSWSKEKVEMRGGHRARLAALNRLLRFWMRLSPRPLGKLKHADIGDHTLMELLMDQSVPENTVCEALRDIAGRVTVDEQEIQRRSIAEIARERGWTKVSPERTEQTVGSLRRRQDA